MTTSLLISDDLFSKIYHYAEQGDASSALALFLGESEKLIALGLRCEAERLAAQLDLTRAGPLFPLAHRFTMLLANK